MTQPNRDNETYPDIEQEKRAQARLASAFARGEVSELPPFVTKGPDATVRDEEYDPETGVVRSESSSESTNPEPVEVTPEEPVQTTTPEVETEPEPAPSDDQPA